MNKDTNLYKVVNVSMQEDLRGYCELALRTADELKKYFTKSLGNDVFQCSAIRWVTYIHISHTYSGKKDNATPLFDWEMHYEKSGKILISISVQVHHSFVEGVHVEQFAEKLQRWFDEL